MAAIQVKCFDPGHVISASDLTSFLAITQQGVVERIVITTSTKWGRNAVPTLLRQQPPVQRFDCFALVDGGTIDWEPYLADASAPLRPTPRKELRDHQKKALNDIVEGLRDHDRGKLIMACGTGKTLTALHIAETIAGASGRVLVCAPSISLLAQVMREWTVETRELGQPFVVCSDVQVGRRTASAADADAAAGYDLVIPPTTNPQRLADAIAAAPEVGQTVIFCTYQSLSVIQEAQELGMPEFDLAVCDEAHRTTGVTRAGDDPSHFVLIHDAAAIRARKRLYMTATPRIYLTGSKTRARKAGADYYSMDEESTYGPELHRLTFHEAVEQKLLADYKVLVLAVNQARVARRFADVLKDPDHKLDDAAKIVGCLNGLAKTPGPDQASGFLPEDQPMRRAVAFANTIKASKVVTELVAHAQVEDRAGLADRVSVEASHVDGTDGVLTRSERLAWLGGESPGQCRVLSNARCLTEGIDVPALDAVLFLQPRKSQIDVVQAVGRIMRKVEGKEFGYVILPIVIPLDQEPEQALAKNAAYIHVWEVLQALRSHDERFDAHVNQIDLRKKRDDVIKVIGVGFEGDGQDEQAIGVTELDTPFVQPTLDFEPWADAIYARIVQNVGDRRYWDRWANSVTDIAASHETRIHALIDSPTSAVRPEFADFADALRDNLNESIRNEDAVSMLSQHMITRPIFEALFSSHAFTQHNPVSQVMQRMVETLEGHGLEAETAELEDFYASVRRRIKGIDTTAGRQRVIRDLYENFFRVAFPNDARALGVVYTPVEIVDFILSSVETLLQREFHASLSDPGVHVLDPFAGTGTFVARLLESGYLRSSDLHRKYRQELHANEILLLAYYIAAVNIETTFEGLLRSATNTQMDKEENEGVKYKQFEGIVLTDTFQLSEAGNRLPLKVFPRNSSRAKRQLKLPDIRVIVGNPPWSIGQRSQNDNNPRQPYPTLDIAIEKTYAAASKSTSKRGLYDSYVRALRWASNRVLGSEGGGIIAFVTNGSFIDTKSFDGFRKSLAQEFHAIYCLNLRGNARGSGEARRREAGSVFGGGTRTTVAILLLVKRPEAVVEQPSIHYVDIGDYLGREEKLDIVHKATLDSLLWSIVEADDHGDWINQRDPRFLEYRPLARVRGEPGGTAPVFDRASGGMNTSRDVWMVNSSGPRLVAKVEAAVTEFNEQCAAFGARASVGSASQRLATARQFITRDATKFNWDRGTEQRLARGRPIAVSADSFRIGSYRPFFRQHVYMDRALNAEIYQMPKAFPTASTQNVGIYVTSRAFSGIPGVLAVDSIPVLQFAGPLGRIMPRYIYDWETPSDDQADLFSNPKELRLTRRDNLSNSALAEYRSRYGLHVTPDDVFAYVYAMLHSLEYRERYKTDLSKLLPRIPVVATSQQFHDFVQAGEALLDLHVGYENVQPYDLHEDTHFDVNVDDPGIHRVTKMRFAGSRKSQDRSTIIYNEYTTLRGIPDKVHDYLIGPRSALDWVMDRYQVKTDGLSGIVNDPNDWASEHGEPRYILDLVKRIVTVSLETVRIVRNLPPLDEAP